MIKLQVCSFRSEIKLGGRPAVSYSYLSKSSNLRCTDIFASLGLINLSPIKHSVQIFKLKNFADYSYRTLLAFYILFHTITSPVKWICAVYLHVKIATLDLHVNVTQSIFKVGFRDKEKEWGKKSDDITGKFAKEFNGTNSST